MAGVIPVLLAAGLLGTGLLGCADKAAVGPGGDSGEEDDGEPGVAGAAEAPDDLLAIAGEEVSLEAGASTGTGFSWDFGDGEEAIGEAVTHAWSEPGRYLVTLTADGSPPDSDSLHVTVVNPPLDPAPVASGMLVGDGTWLYAALPDFDQVAVIDPVAGEVVDRLDVCDRPTSLSLQDGLLAVGCRDGAERWLDGARIDDFDGAVTAVLEHDGLWRLHPDGTLTGPDGDVPALPGRVLVGWQGTVATAAFKSPEDHAEWTDGTTVQRIERDPGPDSDTNARGVPNLLLAGALRPDGEVVVWGGLKDNTERGLYVEGTEFSHDNVVRSSLEVIDVATGQELPGPLFDNRDRIGALAFTPMGDRLLVAHHGAGVVDILDGTTFLRFGGFQGVGVGLEGLWTDGDVAWVLIGLERQLVAFDLTAADNQQIELFRIDLVDEEILPADVLLGAQVFHAAGDRRMSTDAYISCGSCHPDGGEDGRTWDFTQRGEGLRNTLPIFGMPADGPFHWSANFDELQDFENDIRLHQHGSGYLDEADWDEAMAPLGPEKAGRAAELDALAAYMQHLADDAVPPPLGAPADDRAFLAAGCADCHTGDRLTDAQWLAEDEPLLHDVGTLTEASGHRLDGELTGLRTPGLRGVAHTGPWLHDGSAATLEDAVLAHEGVVLDEAELAEIVAYLRGR